MKRLFRICVVLMLTLFVTQAAQGDIIIGSTTFELDLAAFPTAVSQILGSTPGAFGGVSAADGLVGADITTGAFNLASSQVFELTYGTPIVNLAGDDIYFTDGRFSTDGLDFSLDGGSTFHSIAGSDFADTGVDSTIVNTNLDFNLFAATIDMSDFGFAPGASISSLRIRGVSQSDVIVVGNLNVVPVPGAVLLAMLGLSVAGVKLRKRA